MKIEDQEIWTALKDYVKSHPIHYFKHGKEFVPKNFRFQAPTMPLPKEACDDGYDVSITGSCLFDEDMYQQKVFRLDCRAHIAIINNKVTITEIENDQINIKDK